MVIEVDKKKHSNPVSLSMERPFSHRELRDSLDELGRVKVYGKQPTAIPDEKYNLRDLKRKQRVENSVVQI